MLSPHKISKISRFFIYFTLFLPLFVVPLTLWEFVFVRNLIFYCLVTVLLFLGLLYLYKDKHNISFKANVLFWLIFGFIIIRLLSGIFGIDAQNSFFGSQFRMGGNLGYIMLFGWLIALLLFLTSHEDWKKLFKVSVIVALFVSIFAVIQAFFPSDFGALSGKDNIKFLQHRLIGSFGNPIFLAGYLLPNIFLSLFLTVKENKKKSKYFWFALTFCFLIIILLTRTRGAILSLTAALILVGGAFIFYSIHSKRKFQIKNLIIFSAPLLILMAIIAVNTNLISRLTNFSLSSGTIVTRLMLWKIGINAFFDKWLFGWGPENFSYAFSKFYNPQILKYSFYETWADKPHNQFIEIAAETGIFGFVFFSAIILGAFYIILRLIQKDKESFLSFLLIIGAIVSYLIHIFFAFNTMELCLILFAIFGYLIFLSNNILGWGKKLSFGLARNGILLILLAGIFSLNFIGAKTIYASHYANRALYSIRNNKYLDSGKYFQKLKDLNSPYAYGNLEILADIVLKSDAKDRLPKTTAKNILPILIQELERACEKHPENFSYHYRLAQMYNSAGSNIDKKYFAQAINMLEKAKNISPKRQVSDLLLAQVYFRQREVDKGIQLLKEMIEENSDIAQPYWFLGILYDANGEYEKSYAYMSAAVDKGYGLRNINEELLYVTALGRFNDYERMAPIYERIIAKDKNNPKWRANSAAVYLELEKYEKARNATRQAIFLDPKFGDEGENFLRKIDEKQYGK